MNTKKFGYIRVSSRDQNEARQIRTMQEQGIEERDIFTDKQSGRNFERPQYQSLKEYIRQGDTIVFDSITRMGRNMDETLKEYNWFIENGINLEFIKEPMINTSSRAEDVVLRAVQQAVLVILTAFAQKEREDIKVRQEEGIKVAQQNGVQFGRPKAEVSEEFIQAYTQWKAGEITATKAMEQAGMKRTTFYKLIKEYEGQ